MNSVLVGLLARNLYKMNIKSYSVFATIPYKEQYESRDNENEEIVKRCKSYGEWIKNNMNSSRELRQEKIHEFLDSYNPCKTKHISHVSENLDNNLKEFYKNKYHIDH